MASNKKIKQPVVKAFPAKGKHPHSENPDLFLSQFPSWRFDLIDFDGRWGWLNVKEKKDIQDIIEKLNQFESMTWGEIKGNKKSNHTIHTDKICKEARERLKERELDDLEEIFSLRLTATHRVWGKLERGVFHIIWWDPCHEICPSMLKHT